MPPIEVSQIKEPLEIPTPGKKEIKEEEALLQEMDRNNSMEATAHWWKRILLAVCFLFIILIIIVRVLAMIVPPMIFWLTPEDSTRIDEFFVHDTIGAIIASYLGKYFRKRAE